ncbi:MAG TPA: protein kinase [Vicinamibacterales bacterium]|nr:protein kinase [Vicinamibacterales bacterium]
MIAGKYRIDRLLGIGGMGVVFRARHLALEKSFALKVIELSPPVDPETEARFRLEAAALGRLRHPNIVDVTDFGIDGRNAGLAYLVMEYLEGRTLAEYCLTHRPPSIETCMSVLEGVAAAIDYAHANGVIHRDLKPSNVFLVGLPDGQSKPKVLDFGLARFFSPNGIASSDATTKRRNAQIDRPSFRLAREAFQAIHVRDAAYIVGTPGYMAPEVLRREQATPSVDIYSLGVIAYEIFTGQVPQTPPQADDCQPAAVSRGVLPPSQINSALPAEIDDAVLQLLSTRVSDRPDVAAIAVDRIRRAIAAAKVREWHSRERPRRLGVAVACALVLTLTAGLSWQTEPLQLVERNLIDARIALSAVQPPDPRLLVISLDDATLAADNRALAQRADEFGTVVDEIFRHEARAIAIDLLLPESWSTSTPFVTTVLRHPDRLTLAALSLPTGEVVGPECARGVITSALGAERASALFGLVNLAVDADGVTRRPVVAFRDASGGRRDAFAGRAANTFFGDSFARPQADVSDAAWIDFRVDPAAIRRLSWINVSDAFRQQPDLFRSRLVLIGGDFAGSGDDHAVPHRSDSSGRVSGLVVQALIANTILTGFPVRGVSTVPALLIMTPLTTLFGFLVLSGQRLTWPLSLLLLGLVVYAVTAFVVFYSFALVLPIVGPVTMCVAATAVAVAVRQYLGGPPSPDPSP